jgi:putative ABC transport system permease protein
MWPIAIKTLISDRGKLLTALIGVIFSIVLMNVQGGLFVGLIRRAGLLVDRGEADIWVGHKFMHNVDFPADIPRRWLDRLRTVPGVRCAEPYLVGWADMTLPSGAFESVVVIGVEEKSQLGGVWNLVEGEPNWILKPDGIVVDRCENQKLEYPKLGDSRELAGQRATIVGFSQGIMGFLIAPYVFTTYEHAAAYLRKSSDVSSYYLLQLEPGCDVDAVCEAVRQRVPDLDAFPRETYSKISIAFWMTRTGLGLSFGAATLLGLFVGLIMVAQTLYALVLDRLGEFGTLKAIGATERQVFSILFVQAISMALIGSLIGLVFVSVIQWTYHTPKTPIVVPWWVSMGSCTLVLVICLVAAMLPYLRIRKVDPMMVLQS